MNEKKEHFAIDLDGTLLEYDGWKGEFHFGKAFPGAVDWVKKQLLMGNKVTVFTTRGDSLQLREHLQKQGFPELPITNIKLASFTVFIDDRAIRFENINFYKQENLNYVPWWKNDLTKQ
jgi:ribonucleotide monophosphatase NagD (HAD superfamily)